MVPFIMPLTSCVVDANANGVIDQKYYVAVHFDFELKNSMA